jgi:hypothetical protein
MKEEEKAKELVDKFSKYVSEKDFFGDNRELDNAKQCALIAVDEILNTGTLLDENMALISSCDEFQMLEFWQQVKTEIENI